MEEGVLVVEVVVNDAEVVVGGAVVEVNSPSKSKISVSVLCHITGTPSPQTVSPGAGVTVAS